MLRLTFLLWLVGFLPNAVVAQTTWVVDAAHSSVQFKVKHLVISTVTGQFKQFSGQLVVPASGQLTGAKAEATLQVASLDTGNEERDNHLQAADFFDAANHPTMHFASTRIEQTGTDTYQLHGSLTIRGMTKPITLTMVYGGEATFFGQKKAGITATGQLNRFDYGLQWNRLLETGGAVVGETVHLELNLELIQQ